MMKIDDLPDLDKLYDFSMPEIEAPPIPANPVYETRRLNRIDQQRDRHNQAYARSVQLAMIGKHLETRRTEHNAEGTILVAAVYFLVVLLVVGVVIPLAVLPVDEDIGWNDIHGDFWFSAAEGKLRPVVLLAPTLVAIAGGAWVIRRTRSSKISSEDAPDGYQVGLEPLHFSPAFAAKERQMAEIAQRAEVT